MSFFKKIFNKLNLGDKKPEEQSASSQTETLIEESDELVTELFLEDLEETLIKSDLGVELSLDFLDQIKKEKSLKKSDIQVRLKDFLLKAFEEDLDKDSFKLELKNDQPNILLIVGVNGVGKTTSIGKLAHKFKAEGKKVLIAAGDTFRAAAEDQLKIWAKRSEADFIELEAGAKSSAVVFKAIEKIKEDNHDVLIVDTAGRLQNKKNLMEELGKIKKVIDKNAPEANLETMLVLDASTGQNAFSQAKIFMDTVDVNSIILTKFDGTSKAGMIFSIAHKLRLPVKLVGVGEGLEDLKDFDLDDFIKKYL